MTSRVAGPSISDGGQPIDGASRDCLGEQRSGRVAGESLTFLANVRPPTKFLIDPRSANRQIFSLGKDHLITVASILRAERHNKQFERAKRRVLHWINSLRKEGAGR